MSENFVFEGNRFAVSTFLGCTGLFGGSAFLDDPFVLNNVVRVFRCMGNETNKCPSCTNCVGERCFGVTPQDPLG